MKKALFYILYITALSSAKGQDIEVTAAFDSTRILIGDQINFTVVVEQPADINLIIPRFSDTLVSKVEVLAGPYTDSSSLNDGRLRITEKYLITSFDSGFYKVDPVYAEVRTTEGLKRFFSDPAMLEVMKYRVAPADTSAVIYDIIDPYRAPVTFSEILPWALVGIVAAAILWAAIILVRKYKRKKEGKEIVINPDPAHVIAFRELEKLRDEELWQKGQYKPYYTRLTEILRQYLENRYSVYSLEMTTYETLNALLKTGFKKDESFNQLKTVLTSADLVKFAKHVPENSENEAHFKSSWEFVQRTRVTEMEVHNDDQVKTGEGSV